MKWISFWSELVNEGNYSEWSALENEVWPTQDLLDFFLALVLPFRIQHEKEDEESQGVAHGFRTGLEEVYADTHEVFIGEVGVVPHCSQVCINEILFRQFSM